MKQCLGTVSSLLRQKSPQAVSFQRGFVHVPLRELPSECDVLVLDGSVITQRLLSKHVQPQGQQSVVNAKGLHGTSLIARSPPGK